MLNVTSGSYKALTLETPSLKKLKISFQKLTITDVPEGAVIIETITLLSEGR